MLSRRDWVPVAPTWERDPDVRDVWRKVAVMPTLALNHAEIELLTPLGGRSLHVLGVGDGNAALALAAMGARVTAVDSSQSLLDMLMVRNQTLGLPVEFQQSELADLAAVKPGSAELAYAAQITSQIEDLGRFYGACLRALAPGGRLLVNEYHPFRRIWKQEPGHPQVRNSYFQHVRPRSEFDQPDPTRPGSELLRIEYLWTVSDHVHHLVAAGFRIAAVEEVGEVRQQWEVPNLRGIPEQLIIAADKPAA
jgi:SAM-dependent methyltransferase